MNDNDTVPENGPDSQTQIPLIWRIVAIVIAVVIIGVLLYPYLNRRSSEPAEQAPLAVQVSSDNNWFEQGQQHYQRGEWEQAIAAYQAAIEADPEHQSAYVNLGDAYYQANQLELAIQSYQQALELDENDADVIYNLGAAYFQQALAGGNVDEAALDKAIAQIERAIELNPQLPHPYYALGEAYRLLNDNAQAITAFETFLELDDGSDATATSTARQRLEELQAP